MSKLFFGFATKCSPVVLHFLCTGPRDTGDISLDIAGKLPGTPLLNVRTQSVDAARTNPRLRQGASLDGGERLVQRERRKKK